MYKAVVLRHMDGQSAEAVLVSESFPTIRETLENMLDKSADVVGQHIDLTRAGISPSIAEKDLNANDLYDPDISEDTWSTITSCSLIDCEECNNSHLADSMVVDFQEEDEDEVDISNVGDGKKGSTVASGTIPKMPSLADPTATPTSVLMSRPKVKGYFPWATGSASPHRRLPRCIEPPPTGERAQKTCPVKAAQLQDQGKPLTAHDIHNQEVTSSSAAPTKSKSPFLVRSTKVAVNNPPIPKHWFVGSVGSVSTSPTLPIASTPQFGSTNPTTMPSIDHDFALAITVLRQPRGDWAKRSPLSIAEDSPYYGFEEKVLGIKGRPSRHGMRDVALGFIQQFPEFFDQWLDLYRNDDIDNGDDGGSTSTSTTSRGGGSFQEDVSVSQLSTVVTQAVFMVPQMTGGVLAYSEQVTDIEHLHCEDLSGLCRNKKAAYDRYKSRRNPWCPLFEMVVSNPL